MNIQEYIKACSAPDYIISQKKGAKQPVFFIVTKDLFDSDLDGMRQHKEQFNYYKPGKLIRSAPKVLFYTIFEN